MINGQVVGRYAFRGTPIYDTAVFRRGRLKAPRGALTLRVEAFPDIFNGANVLGRNGTYGNTSTPLPTFGQASPGLANSDPGRMGKSSVTVRVLTSRGPRQKRSVRRARAGVRADVPVVPVFPPGPVAVRRPGMSHNSTGRSVSVRLTSCDLPSRTTVSFSTAGHLQGVERLRQFVGVVERQAVDPRDDVAAEQDRLAVDRQLEHATLQSLLFGRAARLHGLDQKPVHQRQAQQVFQARHDELALNPRATAGRASPYRSTAG